MNINNILIVSPMVKDLKRLIEKEQIDKKTRYLYEEELRREDLEWADALVAFNLKKDYDYSLVSWVHSLGAGVDRFLYKKVWNENVVLTRTVCSFGKRIAEYCLSYILKDLQFHNQFKEHKRSKSWNPITPKLLKEQKVLVYGTGEIGQMIAKILSFMGVEVFGVSLSGHHKEYFKEVKTFDSHHNFLADMNYIVNTLPLTEQTTNLFNDDIFKSLRNAGFINVGRGASLDEQALLDALNQNHLRFAVLDVFSQEPLPESHSFWDHPSIILTPHISAVTTPEEGVSCFLETLKNIEEDKPLLNQVDVKKGY
ncbi:D-2-hydroxyacid dehydrogenase [Bacillus sp. MRMR6]|uniref:D-2-hydroxyacid dehydrogenase n=1 Tax=Bacillus sp. MRMR6 TaxID=1928617 RepID=UPI000950DFEA|nr:D-2-hydroxyacid dehydrogenase [Bacillus sp. MRMR6]OLS33719.1 dihydrofolate reductase [Bacillus sp. MRMR6]